MDKTVAERINSIVCISSLETQEILYLNQIGREHFKDRLQPSAPKSGSLFFSDPKELREYNNARISKTSSWLWVYSDVSQNDYAAFLDSTVVIFEGQQARIDIMNIAEYEESRDYYTYLLSVQSIVRRLEEIYQSGDSLRENVEQVLDTLLYVYGADRAFVFEADFDLNYAVDIYKRFRPGFKADQEMRKDLQKDTMEQLCNALKKGTPLSTETTQSTNVYYRERLMRHKVIRTMSVPFSRRTGMNYFLGVDNPRRYYKHYEILRIASYMLAADINAPHRYTDMLGIQMNKEDKFEVDIRLFGGLEIQTALGCIRDRDFSSAQCCTLLIFLLNNRRRVVSVREIADILWPEQLLDHPYNMVKSVVFRTRKILEKVCPEHLIVASKGTYMINRKIQLHMDTDEFEALCHKASMRSKSQEERLELYAQLIELYRGSMLPGFEAESWLMARISYFQFLYVEAVTEYISLLADGENFVEMFKTASKALEVEYLDSDLHYILVETLMRKGRYEQARSYYLKLGNRLTPQQRKKFQKAWNERTVMTEG